MRRPTSDGAAPARKRRGCAALIRIGAALAVALSVSIAAPDGASARDRAYCCWKIDVRTEGDFLVTVASRAAINPPEGAAGFNEPGDINGTSRFNWVSLSRGLYWYRELGRQRHPLFADLWAAKERLRFRESGEWCEEGPIESRTEPGGESPQYSQQCTEPARSPCESSVMTAWKDGSGAQILGRPGARKLAVYVMAGGRFPVSKCTFPPYHGPSDLGEHGLQGPDEYIFALAGTTGAKLRGRRNFKLAPPTFRTTRDTQEEQPHAGLGSATVKVTFTYFPRRQLRRQRRAIAELR